MLMAYEDNGKFKVAEYPGEEVRIGPYPIDSYSKATEIFEWAKGERPQVQWLLEGNSKAKEERQYRVRE